MPQLFFETLEPQGDRLSKDGGNFEYGLFGEGSPTPTPGARIKAVGTGPNDYRVLRPRLTLPANDNLQIQMQSRVLSHVATTADFQGVGSQIRAFNSSGPVSQVDINRIDQDPGLWLREGSTPRWRNIVAVHTIPEGVGADQFTAELLVHGAAGGFCDVTSLRIRTIHDRLESWFNAGPDARVLPPELELGSGVMDIGPVHAVNLVRGHKMEINFTTNLLSSGAGFGDVYLFVLMRDAGTNIFQFDLSLLGQVRQAQLHTFDKFRLINISRPVDQVKFQVLHTPKDFLSGQTFTFTQTQIDMHIGDVIKNGA